MKTNKITMQDIADRLNISKNSVSLALNGKPGVSDETRELIVSLAHKLGYSVPENKSPDSCNNILVFIPEYIIDDRYFYNDIYWSVDHYSKKYGYNAIMTTITAEMQDNNLLPKICSEIPFIGILLIGILQDDYVRHLTDKYKYVLSVDNCYYALSIPCVVTANMEGAYTLTKEVIRLGHSNIGFIGSTAMTSSIYERWCGFNLAMQETGLSAENGFNIKHDSPLGVLLSDPDELLCFLKEMPKLPTAFICGGDRIAIACINALKQLGYRIPEDISVVGFDNIEIGQYITPTLTTMNVKRREMGKVAVSELLKMARKQEFQQRTSLFPEYVKRESLLYPNP